MKSDIPIPGEPGCKICHGVGQIIFHQGHWSASRPIPIKMPCPQCQPSKEAITKREKFDKVIDGLIHHKNC